jgi:TRAP-type C4-dicarboxylate transport system permease small subunit
MSKIFTFIDKTSNFGGACSSLCILVIVLMILLEIAVRSFSGQSTFITEEYSGYLLCWFAFLGLAYTLKTDGHIRVTMLLGRLGPRKKALMEILSGIVGLGVFVYLTTYLGMLFFDSVSTGVRSMHVSQTPLFIPQIVPVLGSALMAVQFVSFVASRWKDVSGSHPETPDGNHPQSTERE